MLRHPGIGEAAVRPFDMGNEDKRLVAYFAPAAGWTVPISELRDFLAQTLPMYMVPHAYVMLDTFPLTPNGKIDRNALPPPSRSDLIVEEDLVLPRTRAEEVLGSIYSEVLGHIHVSVNDDFYHLGGDSLSAARIVARLRDLLDIEIDLRSVFENPRLCDLAAHVESMIGSHRDVQFPAIEPMARGGDAPLSFSQERVWFTEQLAQGNKAYYAPATLRLRGPLNLAALEQSLSEIIRRHEILRTTFPTAGGTPAQRIHQDVSLPLSFEDLAAVEGDAKEVRLQQLINEEIRRPFDLTELPLVRWVLIKLHGHEHVLIHVEHHLLHDGWSFNVFLKELVALYGALCDGKPSPLAEPRIQFADFAIWQRAWMKGEQAQQQLDYWKQQLEGSPSLLVLPYDRPRPAAQSFEGAQVEILLSADLCNKAYTFSRQEGVTLFMTLMTAFSVLLYRYCGQDDLCVATGMANRQRREAEDLLGMVINNVVLRMDLSGEPTAKALLSQAREVVLQASANQDVPFDQVVGALRPKRDLAYNPLFQVMFGMHDAPMPDADLRGLAGALDLALGNGSAKFDLTVTVFPHSARNLGSSSEPGVRPLFMIWNYASELFDSSSVARMAQHFETILKGVVTSPETPISRLPLLSDVERHQLLVEWNETATDYPPQACVHELFERQAAAAPEAVALVLEGMELSYGELNARANRLAHRLARLGVGADDLVGVCVERSLEMVVGVLAVLKAGGAYVPLDPGYPPARLSYMLADAVPRVLLTQRRLAQGLPAYDGPVLYLDEFDWDAVGGCVDNPEQRVKADNLAYVIYTSGSTGRPKGTCIEHRSVVRLVQATNYVELGPTGVFLQFGPISFDASTFELWGSLLNGARLVVFPPRMPTLAELGRVIRDQGVNTLFLTTALFNQMVDEELSSLVGVRQLFTGGEVASVPHMQRLLVSLGPGQRLVHVYGPTENTTFTTYYVLDSESHIGHAVPIGRPISNTRVYVLDRALTPTPVGAPGELYIGGDGLARGYFNRPQLTAEKFVEDPTGGGRLYRSGDIARYLADGSIEFLGPGRPTGETARFPHRAGRDRVCPRRACRGEARRCPTT